LTVDVDAKVDHCGRRLDKGRKQRELGGGQLGKPLSSSEPHQLSLVGVHSQPVASHPGVNAFNAADEALS